MSTGNSGAGACAFGHDAGAMGFGGGGVFANAGTGDAQDPRRQIDLGLEAGVNLIDTADIDSMGEMEEIVGQALGPRRDGVILTAEARFPMGAGPSRHHPVRACEASLQRLGTTTSTSPTARVG